MNKTTNKNETVKTTNEENTDRALLAKLVSVQALLFEVMEELDQRDESIFDGEPLSVAYEALSEGVGQFEVRVGKEQ